MTPIRTKRIIDSKIQTVDLKLQTDRLKEIMEVRGLNPSKLSVQIGISRSAISYFLAGKRQPGRQVLAALANRLSVTVDFLLGISDGLDIAELLKNRRIVELVNRFCELSDHDQQHILEMLKHLRNSQPPTEPASLPRKAHKSPSTQNSTHSE